MAPRKNASALERWPDLLPTVGQFVVSLKDAKHPRVGVIVGAWCAPELWQRQARMPTVLVQWSDQAPPVLSAATRRSLYNLRPATKAEAQTWKDSQA